MIGEVGDGWKLLLGDSLLGMGEGMEEESVDAIVTSPPYADQRLYGRRLPPGARAGDNHRSRAQRREAPRQAVEFLEPFLGEMMRVLRPEGSAAINLGVVMRDACEVPWVDWITDVALEQGWSLLQRIVWHKPNAVPLSWPGFMHVKHEYVLWLAKDARAAYRGFDSDTRQPHSETSLRRIGETYLSRKDERYGKRGKTHELHPEGARPATVFSAGVGQQYGVEHPAVMSPDLARWLVSLTTPKGGLVLDPFAGSATTGLAALERGRYFLGFEQEEPYYREAVDRLRFGRFPRRPPPSAPDEQLGIGDLVPDDVADRILFGIHEPIVGDT